MRNNKVILIPGIQGTTLLDSNRQDFKTVWSGVKKFFSDIHQLTLRDNGVSDKHLDAIIERADVEDLAYSEIVNYLKSQGYRVYIFGYDWRKSNAISGQKLAEFVERLKVRFGNVGSFNFITHSMGALVFSSYLKSLDRKERDKVVNSAIMTVPPFLGSVEACLSLTIGSSMLVNSSDDFRKVARTFPAIYELLPVYKKAYKFNVNSAASGFDHYDFDSYWQQVNNADRPDTIKLQTLIRNRLKYLGQVRDQNDFIFDFKQQSASLRKKCVVISGTGAKTRQQTKIKTGHKHYKYFFEFDDDPRSKKGDGTVPEASAHAFKDSLTTIAVKKTRLAAWLDSRLVGGGDHHAFFLNNGRVQNIITRFLSDSTKGDNWFESADDSVKLIS